MGHAFGIFMAHVGALRLRLRRRLPVALGSLQPATTTALLLVRHAHLPAPLMGEHLGLARLLSLAFSPLRALLAPPTCVKL
ncbi:MAG: hypothetical protein KGI52_10450, partial [Burkholderiales bacterium]|nr:hypothetical protein [Burkholderiales bacterium]